MEELINKAKGYEQAGVSFEAVVCDPLFWQALGKECGWTVSCSQCGRQMEPRNTLSEDLFCWCCMEDAGDEKGTKLLIALRFHEINLTEGFDAAINYLRSVCGIE